MLKKEKSFSVKFIGNDLICTGCQKVDSLQTDSGSDIFYLKHLQNGSFCSVVDSNFIQVT